MGGCCGRPNTTIEASSQKPTKEVKLKTQTYVQDDDKPWLKVTVGPRVKMGLHEHEIFAMPDLDDDEWACNGIEIFKTGCYGGITDFHQTRGIQGWRCPIEDCDFDICKTCVQYTLYVE